MVTKMISKITARFIFSGFLLVAALAFSGCAKDPKKTGFQFFPDMVYAVPNEAYSENPLMKDGKTMQLPPKGSIARGRLPFRYGPGDEEAMRASDELKNPYPTTEKSLARGKVVFSNYCLHCHGPKGEGDGPLIPKFPNPPSFTSRRVRAYTEGRLFHVASNGMGLMPSHKEQIDEADRWYVVQYVQTLQKAEQ